MRWPLPLLAVAACAAAGPFPGRPFSPARVARRSEMVLRCTPADAEVWLDGVPQGSCDDFDGEPRALGLGQAARRVEVKKHGFQTWQSWTQADGTRVVMDVNLVPNGGSTP